MVLDIKLTFLFSEYSHCSQRTKSKKICTMDDVRGDILGPPHGKTPAAVIANKNIKVSSFESNENTQRQSLDHIAKFLIMNPHQ